MPAPPTPTKCARMPGRSSSAARSAGAGSATGSARLAAAQPDPAQTGQERETDRPDHDYDRDRRDVPSEQSGRFAADQVEPAGQPLADPKVVEQDVGEQVAVQ